MDTKYVISTGGTKIAYSIIGKGPALLLVHGGAGGYDKSLWINTKWIDKLKEHFLIITPDIRGYGESDK
jgi:pimeloyl-ACP methyl ester carboxylesterase